MAFMIRRPAPGAALKPVGVKAKLPLKTKPAATGGFGTGPKPKATGAFAIAEKEAILAEERRSQPFRKSIKVGADGPECEVFFTDRGGPWSHYEHNIGGGPNSRGTIVPCIKDGPENCPACSKEGKEGAFVMFLTCVTPLERYTNKEGDKKTIRWRKQPFPIKIKMAKKYQRLYEAHGTFRGMVVKIHRDGKMDAATGNDVEFVRMMTEAEIQRYAKELPGVTDKKTRDDLVKANIAEPIDYAKVMPRPTAAKLAAMIGAATSKAGQADFAPAADDEEGFESSGWGDEETDE